MEAVGHTAVGIGAALAAALAAGAVGGAGGEGGVAVRHAGPEPAQPKEAGGAVGVERRRRAW